MGTEEFNREFNSQTILNNKIKIESSNLACLPPGISKEGLFPLEIPGGKHATSNRTCHIQISGRSYGERWGGGEVYSEVQSAEPLTESVKKHILVT